MLHEALAFSNYSRCKFPQLETVYFPNSEENIVKLCTDVITMNHPVSQSNYFKYKQGSE